MENRKAELKAELDRLRGRSLEMAAIIPPRVGKRLEANAGLRPSKYDFDSEFELQCRLDANDNSEYPEAAALIDSMRLTRRRIHNLEFEEAQAGPSDTMTC